jgi:hypothetical protein
VYWSKTKQQKNTNTKGEKMTFENILLETIDEELSQLGEKCKENIYFYLNEKYNLKKKEIPFKIDYFVQAIEDIFGSSVRILKIKIMENVFQKIGCANPNFDNRENLDFTKYIQRIRAQQNKIFGTKPQLLISLQ